MKVAVESTAPLDWDAFVQAHPGHSAYHLSGAVEVGRDAFGLDTMFLCARGAGGGLRGVLPLVEQSSRWFGRYLTSLPFYTYGGILASDPAAVPALLDAAAALGARRGARHVELRHSAELPIQLLPERLDKVSMVLPLPGSEVQLFKQISSKVRSQVRRAERALPVVACGGRELLDEFYAVFAHGMRNVGTPVYPRRFFDAFWRGVGTRSRVLVLRDARGAASAAAVLVTHGARVEVPWAIAMPEAKRAALGIGLYWELLRYAVSIGAAEFDFGRSTRDSGTYRFKAQWGAQPLQLHWHYWLPAGAPVPVMNASNPKYTLASALWRRLPLWCANVLGPQLARHLP